MQKAEDINERILSLKSGVRRSNQAGKIKSWREFCNLTSETNPWNAIYKMAAGKTKRATHITTLRLQDGSLTTNLQDTLLHMIQKFAPDDNQEDDTDTHSQIQTLTQKPLDTEEDEEFTVQEVTNVIQDMGNNKAPGEDGIPNEVWKCVGTMLPRYMTAIYNGCLRE